MRMVLLMQLEVTLQKGSYARSTTFGLETGSAQGQSPLYFSPGTCGRVTIPGSIKKTSRFVALCDTLQLTQ